MEGSLSLVALNCSLRQWEDCELWLTKTSFECQSYHMLPLYL